MTRPVLRSALPLSRFDGEWLSGAILVDCCLPSARRIGLKIHNRRYRR
jgi:hypothetical protein